MESIVCHDERYAVGEARATGLSSSGRGMVRMVAAWPYPEEEQEWREIEETTVLSGSQAPPFWDFDDLYVAKFLELQNEKYMDRKLIFGNVFFDI